MIKIVNQALKTNKFFTNTTTIVSYFSSNIQTTNYPYVFGGLKNVQFNQNQSSLMTINQLFGSDTLEGFKDAYRFMLTAFAQKELKSFQNICQPNLTKNLNFKNVELINPNANIQVVCGRSFKAFGSPFIRESTTQLKLMQSQDGSDFYLNIGIMNPTNPASVMKYMSTGLPILMGYEILFKTQMKLIPQGQRAHYTPQIHSLQFQVEGKMNIMKFMGFAAKMSGGKGSLEYDEAKKILKEMIGDNFDWKIGDIDQSLKGNFKVLKA